jgi:hypothetical protein
MGAAVDSCTNAARGPDALHSMGKHERRDWEEKFTIRHYGEQVTRILERALARNGRLAAGI